MATFITLVNFTDQGIHNVKESPNRAEAFKSMAQKVGVTVRSIHWTLGHYDMVVVADGTDEAVTAALLAVGSNGNVRTETLRAYTADEFKSIVGRIP